MLNNGWRGVIKSSMARCLHRSGIAQRLGARRGLKNAPLVVGYHRVVENYADSATHSIPSMLISVDTFTQQLEWIAQHYRFVDLDELADLLETGEEPQEAVAAITFDDGYRDVYHHAFPILKKMGIPAAVFVVTDLVGCERLQAHDELYLLLCSLQILPESQRRRILQDYLHRSPQPSGQTRQIANAIGEGDSPYQATRSILQHSTRVAVSDLIYWLNQHLEIASSETQNLLSMSWDMLAEMAANGVTIGSHTKSHALLANESAAVLKEEVEGSRAILERHLNCPVHHFSYPDGSFDAASLEAVACAGYHSACTISNYRDPRYPLLTIPRKMFWQNSAVDGFGNFSSAVLNCQVNGIFDPAAYDYPSCA